jgi:predicted acyl esterase
MPRALVVWMTMTSAALYGSPEPEYPIRVDRAVRVRMRDGVELAAVVVRPDATGRFPGIMNYTPYRGLTGIKDTPSENEYNNTTEGPAWFARHGYAVVYYDVRGTGDSGGSSQDIYSDQERRDAYEMIEWIGTQSWSNGNVGMWGYSYGGVVQWQVGVQNPPHLKTLVVGSSNDDVYLDWTYPGGVLRPYMFDTFAPMMTGYNFAPPDLEIVGEKWSELWSERLEKNVPWGIGFISHPLHDRYWTDRSLQPDYDRIKVPVLLWSGWADCYPTPILRAFAKLQVPKKVLIGPWGHWWPGMAVPGPRIDERRELLRWYDQWLKGHDTGVMREPPVTLFVRTYKEPQERMYDEDAGFWRHETEWPPARTEATPFYFAAAGKLTRQDPKGALEERDGYPYDPTVGTTSGIYWGGGILPWGMPVDQRADEAVSLTYTSEPLAEALEATGAPRAVLYVSSTADTAYFHVKITDVAPDGVSKWVADGGLLATHRNSHAAPEPLQPGQVYELRIDLKYMAYVFPAGHRIRVDVASADFQNAWPVAKAAMNTVHRGRYPSHIVLPVTPPRSPRLPTPQLQASPHAPPKPEDFGKAEHTITRDLVNQTVTVQLVKTQNSKSADGRTESLRDIRSSYTVSRLHPADASMRAGLTYVIKRPEGEIHVQSSEVLASDVSSFRYLSEIEIKMDGKPHFKKSWRVSVPRRRN